MAQPPQQERWPAVVVGGGAAGLFAALRAKECDPHLRLLVLEGAARPLRKVAISGGGRCNVTHACHDLDWLLRCYPRGGPRLEPILARFMPEDTVRWFAERGVELKTEPDGRMFPTTDSSQTVIDALLRQARRSGVVLRTQAKVESLRRHAEGLFELRCGSARLLAERVLLATGGASKATTWLADLGHEVVPDQPSLFTFRIQHPVLEGLQGVSVESVDLQLQVGQDSFRSSGPWLITHWGVSGPAVLRLSAFAARALADTHYRASLLCDLLPALSYDQLSQRLRYAAPEASVAAHSPFAQLPRRLWQRLVSQATIPETARWKQLTSGRREQLIATLKALRLEVNGKGVFKEEFVTAGGVPLHEIDPYTMESRRCPHLYLAGELLDVDGLTGGFNFQNAWATGYIAGEGLSRSAHEPCASKGG